MFRTARGRAAGSVAFLGLWTALAITARNDGRDSSPATLALASALVVGNAAMLAVHLRHHIAGPRVFLGSALSGVALADAIRRR